MNADTGINRMPKSLPLDDPNLRYEGFVQVTRSSSCVSFDRGLDNYPFTVDSPCGRVRLKTRSGDPSLHVIEGPALIPTEIRYVQDGPHPNDEGFTLMANNLAQRIQSL